MRSQNRGLHAFFFFTALLAPIAALHAEPVFYERDGKIFFEIESVPSNGWRVGSSLENYTGDSYYTAASGSGTLAYDFHITNAGTYKLYLRCRHQTGNDLENDCWVAMDNAERIKYFLIPGYLWSWDGKLETSHHVFADAVYSLDAGQHTLAISNRSNGFILDRVAIASAPPLPFEMERSVSPTSPTGTLPTLTVAHKLLAKSFPTEGTNFVAGRQFLEIDVSKATTAETRMPFPGTTGTYQVEFTAVGEYGCESDYTVTIGDESYTYTAHSTGRASFPIYVGYDYALCIEDVDIAAGDDISVRAESDGTSKGMWAQIKFYAKSDGGTSARHVPQAARLVPVKAGSESIPLLMLNGRLVRTAQPTKGSAPRVGTMGATLGGPTPGHADGIFLRAVR